MDADQVEAKILEIEGQIRAMSTEYEQWVDRDGDRHIRAQVPYGRGSTELERIITASELKNSCFPRVHYLYVLVEMQTMLARSMVAGIPIGV